MEKLECECCGAPINASTMTCDYCGMKYKQYNDRLIRIETFRNPVETLQTKYVIKDKELETYGVQEMSKLAINHMIRELADNLAPFVQIRNEHNIYNDTNELTCRIKVIVPENSNNINF